MDIKEYVTDNGISQMSKHFSSFPRIHFWAKFHIEIYSAKRNHIIALTALYAIVTYIFFSLKHPIGLLEAWQWNGLEIDFKEHFYIVMRCLGPSHDMPTMLPVSDNPLFNLPLTRSLFLLYSMGPFNNEINWNSGMAN